MRLQADGSQPENWVATGGRPLGLAFDAEGNLLVADAYIGLLRVEPDQTETLLTDSADGVPIRYANNVGVALDGRYWLGMISQRNPVVDRLSDRPLVRKMVQRLPVFLRPTAVAYGHVAAFDTDGRVLTSLQDPEGAYRLTTGATETPDYLYISSLVMPVAARLPIAETDF